MSHQSNSDLWKKARLAPYILSCLVTAVLLVWMFIHALQNPSLTQTEQFIMWWPYILAILANNIVGAVFYARAAHDP